MKRKIAIIIAIFLVTAAASGFIFYRTNGAGLPYGGMVITSFFCPCSGNWLLTIGPPMGGTFMYNNTPQFAHEQLPRVGVWSVGLYTPGGICLVPVTHGCAPVGVPKGTITPTVGTSL